MRIKGLKSFLFVFSIVLCMTVFVACSSETGGGTDSTGEESSREGSGEVKEITFVAAQYSAETEPFLTELVDQFESENSDIKVNLEVIGWDNLEQSVNTMVSTGQTPDILNLNHFAAFQADDL